MSADSVQLDGVDLPAIALPQHVRRPRIDRLLAAATRARLTGMAAPAGRGVSLALRHWASADDEVLLVDAERLAVSTRREFWQHLCRRAAARGLPVSDDAFGQALPLPVAILRAFERLERRTVLVVDHLDAVPEPEGFCNDLLRLLLATEQLHVLVAAHDLRPAGLPAAQLHVSTCVVDTAAFEFTTEETIELLRLHGREHTPARTEALRRLCRGSVGLLGALAAHGEHGSMDVVGLRGWVQEHVLRPWASHPEFERLMELAVPEHIDADLMEALGIGGPDDGLLDALESAGQGSWDFETGPPSFRIDPLLRHSLEQELRRRSPARLLALREGAVRRELERGRHLEAVLLAARFGQWRSVRHILRAAFDDVLDGLVGSEAFISAVLRDKPYPKDPLLAVVLGLHEAEAGRVDRAAQAFVSALRGAQRVLGRDRDDDGSGTGELVVARVVRFIAFSRLGRREQAAREVAVLEQLLGDIDAMEEAIQPLRLTVHCEIAEFALRDCRTAHARRHLSAAGRGGWAGRPLPAALTALEAAMDGDVHRAERAIEAIDPDSTGRRAAGFTGLASALVALETGRFGDASGRLATLSEQLPDPGLWPIVVATQACVRDDVDGAIADFDTARARYEAAVPIGPGMREFLLVQRHRQLLRARRWREAFRLADECRSAPGLAGDLVRAQSALVAGEHDQAVFLAERHAWQDTTPLRERVALLMIAASAHRRTGSVPQATERANEAVALALATGVTSPLGLVPRDDLDALAGAVAEEVVTVLPDPPSVVRLSSREHAVLAELQRTGSLSQIAAALSVSVNTVRSQLTSLYRKLGVSSRADGLRMVAAGDVIVR